MLSGTEMENQVEKMLMDSSTINLEKHVLQVENVGKHCKIRLQWPMKMTWEKKYVIDLDKLKVSI